MNVYVRIDGKLAQFVIEDAIEPNYAIQAVKSELLLVAYRKCAINSAVLAVVK